MANIGDLANMISAQLQLYANVLDEDIEEITETLTKEAVEDLKANSPRGTGDYAKKWATKKVDGKTVIYNKKYQLTHLLEKGHAKVNGGRVAARVHIRPVEEKLVSDFERQIREAAQG